MEDNLINISMILSTKHKFIFWHIPKTAGTSIRYQLEEHGVDLDRLFGHRWAARYPWPNNWRHIDQEDFKREIANTGLQTARYKELAFVRNPYYRAVSLYNFSKYRPPTDRVGRPFQPSSECTFDEYFETEMTRTDASWIARRQVHWTKYPLNNEVKVFKFEDLPQAWQELQDYVGLTLGPLERHNITAELTTTPLFTVDQLSQSQRDRIYEYNQEDFEAFGYER